MGPRPRLAQRLVAPQENAMIFVHEHWFEAAASIQARMGPIVIRPDGIKDDHLARQYIASVLGILHALEGATRAGNAVVTTVRFYNKPVLIFPHDGQGGRCNAWARRDWACSPAAYHSRLSCTATDRVAPVRAEDIGRRRCRMKDWSTSSPTSCAPYQATG
jgi:hypothetical protein